MKKISLITLSSLLLAGSPMARTWTSSDGTKTFEGDFVSLENASVTVKRGVRNMTFKLELLSEADQTWAKEEAKRQTEAEANEKLAAEFSESDLGKALKKIKKFDGSKFADHELEGAPKYFLLYYTASW